MDTVHYINILKLLKIIDPYTADIIGFAKFVKLYHFCYVKNEWEFGGVQGEFVICSRTDEPYKCFHIINHDAKRSYMTLIFKDMNWEIRKSLILYRNDGLDLAIEIRDEKEYSTISTLMTNILESFEHESKKEMLTPDMFSLIAHHGFERLSGMIEKKLHKADEKNISMANNEVKKSASGTPGYLQKLLPCDHQKMNSSIIEMKDLEKMISMMSLVEENVSKPILITHEMFQNGGKRQYNSAEDFEKPEPLNQKQMIQAVIYLLKNDADFALQIHEAYMKSLMGII